MKKEPFDEGSFSHKEQEEMWLLVGLGNPGKEYEGNRHNVGFMVIDAIMEAFPGFGGYKSKFQGKVSEGRIEGKKAILLKPETYMNKSGESVTKAMQFYKVTAERVMVFHDELDIDFADVRLKQGGGNAGHNGLKSIQSLIGTPDFWRVRIGIGRPAHKSAVSNYVLSDFSKDEVQKIEDIVSIIGDKVSELFLKDPKAYEALIKEKIK